jgi:RimJ/RimL family protein N-acetyltransferase
VITTARLILRPWAAEDLDAYAAVLADPAVADWLGGPLTREATAGLMARSNAVLAAHGYARLAMIRRADGRLLGHCGLMPAGEELPPAPGVEIGWALIREAWGQGYATEAARAVLADGLDRLRLSEILAFTTEGNARSQAVMRRVGMDRAPERDFDHPRFPAAHPLRRHLVFVARASTLSHLT